MHHGLMQRQVLLREAGGTEQERTGAIESSPRPRAPTLVGMAANYITGLRALNASKAPSTSGIIGVSRTWAALFPLQTGGYRATHSFSRSISR